MKTSIKLLLGAFIFVVVLLIIGNVVAAKEFKKVAGEQQNVQVDSIPEGTQSISIKFSNE
jgi:hypothetical protein